MYADYAPSRITEFNALPFWIAYLRLGAGYSGEPGEPEWWNHATGGFEPTFDASKHLAPLKRGSDDAASPLYAAQSFSVPSDVLESRDVQGWIFLGDATGLAANAKAAGSYSRIMLEGHSGEYLRRDRRNA